MENISSNDVTHTKPSAATRLIHFRTVSNLVFDSYKTAIGKMQTGPSMKKKLAAVPKYLLSFGSPCYYGCSMPKSSFIPCTERQMPAYPPLRRPSREACPTCEG